MAWSSNSDSGVITSVAIHPIRNGVYSLIIGGFGVIVLVGGLRDPSLVTNLICLVLGSGMLVAAAFFMRVCVRQTIRVVRAYFR